MSLRRSKFLVSLIALAAMLVFAVPANASGVDDAIKASKQTGKPILIVQGRESCGVCQGLKKKMESDAGYKSTVANYVYLHIDIDKETDVRQAWDKLYPSSETSLPVVQVISSDGRKLYDKGGMVQSDILKDLLSKSGKLLSPAVIAKIQKALDDATKALEDGKTAKAVTTISPALGTGGASETVQNAEAFGKKLIDACKQQITSAEEKLAAEDTAVEGALELLQVSREYAKLKPVAEDLKKVAIKKGHKDYRDAFERARQLDAAAVLAGNNKSKEATAAYKAIIKKYPDSETSKLAEAKMAELDASGSKTSAPAKTAKAAASKAPADDATATK